MAKHEYRIVFSGVPELDRKISDRITVDFYICRSLRLRRNCNYENAPEYSIIGNAGQKRQITITLDLWRILINTVVRAMKPLVVVKKSIGYTRFHGKEVYVEEVFAVKSERMVKLITGEIENDAKENIPGATRKTTYEIINTLLHKAQSGGKNGNPHR